MKPQSHPRPAYETDQIEATSSASQSPVAERHYTVAEVAAMWNLSKDAVRRLFRNEPGVLVLGGHASGRQRRYTVLRIPQSALERVHARCSLVSY